jgi:hypothetical protein
MALYQRRGFVPIGIIHQHHGIPRNAMRRRGRASSGQWLHRISRRSRVSITRPPAGRGARC